MADFCRQCSLEMGFVTAAELADNPTLSDYAGGRPPVIEGMGYPEICEGCGFTHVDENGNCLGTCINPRHRKQSSNFA